MVEPKFNDNALAVLRERYLWKDEKGNVIETPTEMLQRVARCVSKAERYTDMEEYKQKFYGIMARLDFLPNSPTLMNAGRKGKHGQLSACYVLGVEDSMESIFDALKHQAIIHKSGGGTGFNFSKLRPEGSIVNSTNGKASGPVSFMGMFNHATDVVQQGGMRRGANMGILNCDHPDVLKFIHAKTEEGKLTNFNISIAVTDKFMTQALVYGTPEHTLFNEIVASAWKTGDPGIIFIDTINEKNTTPWLGKLEATNPCVTGNTMILTSTGYRRIDECVGETVKVWNGEEFSDVVPQVTGTNQEVMTVVLSNGIEVECTPYHKFLTWKGLARDGSVVKKEAKELNVGDKLMKFSLPVIEGKGIGVGEELMYINGFYSGDGYWNKEKEVCAFSLYNGKRALLPLFTKYSTFATREDGERITVHIRNDAIRNKFWVPDTAASIKERLAWLAGLIDSDGTRNSTEGSVAISSIEKGFLKEVQLMLTTLGVQSTVSVMKDACTKAMPDGHGGMKEYDCKECYRIILSSTSVAWLKTLGLKTKRVDITTTHNRGAGRFVKVAAIKRNGVIVDKVYCFTEEKKHTGIFNGVLLGQCGESPLYSDESCNLGSINLAHMVTENKEVDIERLRYTARLAVRFLDDVIDVNHFPLPQIERTVKRTRKIGLGVMGWAEMLFQMNIPYDSVEALNLADFVGSIILNAGRDSSLQLARERGSFDPERSKYRNATITCIAPTGTISLLAGCSSGIEPVFALKHKRIAFAEQGVGGTELEYYNPYYAEACKSNMSDADLKRLFVTAHDIAPEWHVRHQAAWQMHTDLAVSKTVNLPHDATETDVYNVYVNAWTAGCKGVTVYRDGCKASQVLYSLDAKKEVCPVCGAEVVHEEGCIKCAVCSWGRCSV